MGDGFRLRVGDVFRCRRFAKAQYETRWEGGLLVLSKTELCFNRGHLYRWTEHQERDGWHRDVEHVLNSRADDESRGAARFRVVEAYLGGGGTGHGPHDVYPDGWLVTAERMDGPKETIRFSQSGCFVHAIPDDEIELVEEEVPRG